MENWISASPTQGNKNGSVKVTVEKKNIIRNGTITISGKGITKAIPVRQNALMLTSFKNYYDPAPTTYPELKQELHNGDTLEFIYNNWVPKSSFTLFLRFSVENKDANNENPVYLGYTFYDISGYNSLIQNFNHGIPSAVDSLLFDNGFSIIPKNSAIKIKLTWTYFNVSIYVIVKLI